VLYLNVLIRLDVAPFKFILNKNINFKRIFCKKLKKRFRYEYNIIMKFSLNLQEHIYIYMILMYNLIV